ncbi:cell division protein FtsQ/DivIB [Bordetella genomosp. 13]|uniref:Cell division protein FtsQ n=1 Tax=Bordetella genomosp. 13 TaxID=463040 RepID=A0A1W6ZGK5_9BORD|nr:cell division protein FtsQ/DivIB [Bordetella genomosp. 13]ARP96437.1 cell division protein FtsQ [Bordetella genomosp. 13]
MWNDARTINLIANTLAVLAVAIMLAAGVAWVAQRPYFTLSAIELEPMPDSQLHYVSPGAVRASIAGRFQGNFFTVDLDEAREVFESVPWVRRATVRRIWPNTLRVRIEEQQPLALWNENQMINTWGEAFTANTGELDDDADLPQFAGPEGSQELVVQRYAELARWFAPLDLRVKELELSPRYAWRATLSNDLVLDLGRDPAADAPDPLGLPGALPFAARIQRFVQAWPSVVTRLEGRTVTQADLRYPNGFALALAPLPEPHPQTKSPKKR